MDANPPDGDGCEARLHPISLNTAAVLTGRSMRTWQRRIEDGLAPRLGDGRGKSLVPFEAVRPWLAVPLSEEDVRVLVRADQGDATAQADIGALFALAALSLSTNSAQKNAPAALAPSTPRGGGAILYPHSISCQGLRSRARPMPCTGWACSTQPGWAAMKTPQPTGGRWR